MLHRIDPRLDSILLVREGAISGVYLNVYATQSIPTNPADYAFTTDFPVITFERWRFLIKSCISLRCAQ